jgi:hypothetical protein
LNALDVFPVRECRKLVFSDLDLEDNELRMLIRHSGDDIVRAIALAQDRYGPP